MILAGSMSIQIKKYDEINGLKKLEKEFFLNKLVRTVGFKDITEFKEYVELLINEKYEFKDFRNSFGELLLALINFLNVVDDELDQCVKYSVNEYGEIEKDYLWDCRDSLFNAIDDIFKIVLKAVNDFGYTPDPKVLELLKQFISRFENK